jgi:hypothetical protein
VKKIILIGLIFTYLFTSTEFSEMLKIPFLFNHFTAHQSENNKITFGQFLYVHYVDHSHELNEGKGKFDKDEDSQLPFHSHTDYTTTFTYFFPTPAIRIVSEPFISEVEEGKIFFDNQSLRSFYTPSIWQPPKLG